MAGIDESLTFHPARIAVLTISDTRDEESDKSGLARRRETERGRARLAAKAIVADEIEAIRAQIRRGSTIAEVER